MSPRPPPKISLRHDHDWTRGKVSLGSTVDQQPEGKVVRQSRGEVQHATFSQLTQPILKPICDRSGQPEDMQDVFVVKGETSRSHEINEKGFHRELCSSDRSGQPEITPCVIEARNLSENTRVEQTHDGSGQPDERNSSTAHTVKEQHAPEVHREIASFNTDNEFNCEIIEEDIDFNIPGLPHSTVKELHSASVRELIQKIENHPNRHPLQRDLQHSQSFNPFSQESKQMIHEVGNIELCELLDMEPKAQCKVCLSYWDVGIVYCTCGHFLRKEQRRTINLSSTLWISSRFPITTSRKGDPTGTVTGRSQGTRSITSPIRSRRNAGRDISWVSTTGSSETRFSERTCLTPVALKKCVVRWTNWRTKTTRTTSLQKKFVRTETIGGFVRTQLVPIRCQFGIDLTSNKHCQPCDSSKTKRMQLISKDGKAIPRLGGTGKNPGGILLMSITTKTYPAPIDQGNLMEK